MRTLFKIVLGLIVLTIVLDVAWPQEARDQAAARIAHAICSQKPQPEECGPNGHPWDPLKRLLVGQP